jgi:iron complex outermembrane receptor protein
MKKKLLRCASIAVVVAGAESTCAWAQEGVLAPADSPAETAPVAAAPAEDGLEEIVVTARRVEEKQQDVPVAITTLSADALTERNVGQVSDLQFSVPNMQIKPSNTYPTVPEFIVRGQRQTLFTDENVVTYVNGVAQGTRGITLYDLESVQVLKGPQGTLFGKNSNGGAVILTSKKPESDFSAKFDVDLGNYDLKKATGVVNVPLAGDKAALRVAGQIERRDGVFENSYPGGDDLDDRHNESGRVTLLLRPLDNLESLTTIDGLRRREIPTPAIIEAAPTNNTGFGALVAMLTQQAVTQQSALGGGVPTMDGANLVRQGDPYHVRMPTGVGTTIPSTAMGGHYDPISSYGSKVDIYGIANNSSYDLSDELTVRNIVSYRHEKALDQLEPSGVSGFTLNVSPFLTALGAQDLPEYVPGQLVDNNTNFINRYNTLTEELQLIGNTEHTKFIAGGYYGHDNHLYAVTSNFVVGPADLYQIGPRYGEDRIKTDSTAVFGQLTHDLASVGVDGLSITAGARYTWDKKDFRASNFYANGVQDSVQEFAGGNQVCNELNGTGETGTGVSTATDCYMYGGKTFKAPTWTVSVDYKFNPDTMGYFTTRRGFKAGSSNPATVNHDFAMFDSEKLTDFELGLKNSGRVASVPYRFNVSAFVGKYKDIQTGDILSFCASDECTASYTDLVIFNVGRATIKGVEVEAALKPFRSLELNLAYSYQKASYGDGSVLPQPENPGPIGPNNPIDYEGGQDLSGQDIPGVARNNLSLSATYGMTFIPTSVADTVLSVNYAYRSSTKGNAALGVYKTPSYGVANARLAFNDLFASSYSMAFWISNITDKAYQLSCADNRSSLGYAGCYWGEPRTFGVTGTVRFD